MSYYYNKDWTRVYKVTFNVADIFFHKVYLRDSNNDFIVDTLSTRKKKRRRKNGRKHGDLYYYLYHEEALGK